MVLVLNLYCKIYLGQGKPYAVVSIRAGSIHYRPKVKMLGGALSHIIKFN